LCFLFSSSAGGLRRSISAWRGCNAQNERVRRDEQQYGVPKHGPSHPGTHCHAMYSYAISWLRKAHWIGKGFGQPPKNARRKGCTEHTHHLVVAAQAALRRPARKRELEGVAVLFSNRKNSKALNPGNSVLQSRLLPLPDASTHATTA
jgi:hypothetical protein